MKKLSIGESAFGSCRRLDEDYLNQVLKDDGYVELESIHSAVAAENGTVAPQGGPEAHGSVPLELLKAIRHVNFRSLHRLLSFPLTEMISTAPPDLSAIGTNGEAVGFLVIYGDAGDYLNDGVAWQPQDKLNLKLIVKDAKTNRYKLRNSKSDDGEPVMRRHKRVASNKALGWERHEYKLFTEETAHRQNVDGTKTVVTRRTLNPWPILVHYFRPSVSMSVLRSSIAVASSSDPTHQVAHSAPASTTIPRGEDEEENGEYQRVTKRQKTALGASRDAMQVNESDSENGSISSHGLSRALRSIQTPLFRGEMAPIVNMKPLGAPSSMVRPREAPTLPYRSLDPGASEDALADSSRIDPTVETSTSPKMELSWWNEASAEEMGLAIGSEPNIFVTHYAPDSSFCEEGCPVLVVLGLDTMPGLTFTCFVDGAECPTEPVAAQVLRVLVPAHSSGVVPLWLIGKDAQGTVVTHSESLPFYYLPSARNGALCFAHAPSPDYFTSDVFFKFRHTTRELDLTGNNITNLDFLATFSELRELVLDHNSLSHWAHFPPLPKLTSLSVNHNHILQIDMFLAQLEQAGLASKLKYLSTLGNAANPSFDRLEHRYYNFRIYIISKLPNLKLLDMRDVTDAERAHSRAIFEEELQQQNQESETRSTTSPDSFKEPSMDESVSELAFRTLSASPTQESALSGETVFLFESDHYPTLASSGGHPGML